MKEVLNPLNSKGLKKTYVAPLKCILKMKFYIQCLVNGYKMLLLVNISFKSVAYLYQCLYNSSHSYKLNFTYMFSTTDARTIFSCPVEM